MERDGAIACQQTGLSKRRAEKRPDGVTAQTPDDRVAGAGLGCLAYQFGRFLKPNVLYEPPKSFKLGRWRISHWEAEPSSRRSKSKSFAKETALCHFPGMYPSRVCGRFGEQ